jgi:hypothetical protein
MASTWIGFSQFGIYVLLPMMNENINGGARLFGKEKGMNLLYLFY